MASITDMLVQGATQTAQQSGEQLQSGIRTGAALAQQIEQTKQMREQMEQKKQELYLQKVDKVMEAVEKGAGFKDKTAQNHYFKNYVPGMIKALKVDDFFDPNLQGFMQSPEVRDKLVNLRLDIQDKINRGELRGAQIMEYARGKTTPEGLAEIGTELVEMQKIATLERNKEVRGQNMADASLGKQVQAQAAAPDVKYQATLKADKAKFEGEGGGLPNAEAQIKKLKEVVRDFKSGKLKTGNLGSTAGSLLGSTAQAVINPDLKAAMDKTRASIRLKDSLDSQFAAKEAEQQYSMRTIDPALPTEDNLARAEDMLAEAEALLNSKLKAFGIERKAKGKTYNIGGQNMNETTAKEFFKAYPKLLTPDLKKELGL